MCNDNSRVSVIIPARNAEDTIGQTLANILAQRYRGDVEIIVSNGSDDDAMARMIRREFPQVRVIPNPKQTIPSGLNLAWRLSSGDIIVRCDAHTMFPDGYLESVVSALEKTGAGCVGGMAIPMGSTRFGRAVGMAVSSPLGSGDSRYKVGGKSGPVDTVYLGAYRKETLEQLGGYDEDLAYNEDYELNWRVREGGNTVWFCSELKSEYVPRGTARSWVKQCFAYGRWKSAMLAKHPRSLRPRQLAAPALVTGTLLSIIALCVGFVSLALVVPILYLVVLLVGTCRVIARERPGTTVALFPVALVLMHFSWGAGFFIPARCPIRFPTRGGPLFRI